MVKWVIDSNDDDDVTEKEILVAVHIFLFARLSKNVHKDIQPVIVAVIHSLSSYEPDKDSLLFFAKGNSLLSSGLDVIKATAIQETAFVLPCIENEDDNFPFKDEGAKYFIVLLPQHNKWIDIW